VTDGETSRDRRRRLKQKQRADQAREDMRFMLSEPAGRRVLRRILDRAAVMATIPPGGAAEMAFASGRKDMGHWLISQMLAAQPLSYSQLLAETANEGIDNEHGHDSSDDD